MTYKRREEYEKLVTDQWHELSLEISYALMAEPLNELALLNLILGKAPPLEYKAPLLEAIRFLVLGYGQGRRKSGPLAVLHPLRTAAILSRMMPRPGILDLLGAFLHDREEDLGRHNLTPERWRGLQQKLETLLSLINHDEQWFLGERIAILSRKSSESYFDYLVNILRHAPVMPDLLRIKLADKLDSTYDIQVPPSRFERLDFFRVVFDILFVPNYAGLMTQQEDYFLLGEREAVLLLSSMGKNAIFLSLLRRTGLDQHDSTIEQLFDSLAIASIRQARWVLLELLASSIPSLSEQRALLKEVLAYREAGVIARVTPKERGHQLDGTFLERFVIADDHERKERLRDLARDPLLFAKVVAAMIVLFSCFLEDKSFSIAGIDIDGIRAVS